MTGEELLFFDGHPDLLPLYERLLAALNGLRPKVRPRVGRTQISLYCRYMFAAVSLPWRRVRGWPQACIVVSFVLPTPVSLPRVRSRTEAYPGRWTHHVAVEKAEDIDGELLALLAGAYDFAMVK